MAQEAGLQVLLDALRRRLAGAAGSATNVSPEAIAIANRNKVLGLAGGPGAEDAFQRESELRKLLVFQNNSRLLLETLAVCKLLTGGGIRFAVIKGPLQQRLIYNDLFVRRASDIDILVGVAEFAHARAILQEGGCELLSPSLWWWAFLGEQHLAKPGPIPTPIDLHYSLHQPGTPVAHGGASLLKRVVMARYAGIDVPVLATGDVALLSAISLAKALYNREPGGAHLCDLFALLMADAPRAVERFVADARRERLSGHAAIALRALRAVFGLELPAGESCEAVLPGTSDAELVELIFVPDTAGLKVPRRRTLVWEYCGRNAVRYGLEFGRMGASELALKAFERRPAPVRSAGPDGR